MPVVQELQTRVPRVEDERAGFAAKIGQGGVERLPAYLEARGIVA
jgi:hypothetical protein